MRAYQDMVFSTAARLAGNDTQAEDIAQEVFAQLSESLPQALAPFFRDATRRGGWRFGRCGDRLGGA